MASVLDVLPVLMKLIGNNLDFYIKPQNILFSDDNPKISDFLICRTLFEDNDSWKLYKTIYTAPEIFR
jgi:hypothetical protein